MASGVDAAQAYGNENDPFANLNKAQRQAVEHGVDAVQSGDTPSPLLIIAGAGTGKTATLTARVARLVIAGADPRRILLLTFTRKAAAEMTRRASGLIAGSVDNGAKLAEGLSWSGTFHATAQQLLRLHARQVGLSPDFTLIDQGDAEDLMGMVRDDEQQTNPDMEALPKKGTCLSIYSHTINTRGKVEDTLAAKYPQYAERAEDFRRLFKNYMAIKQRKNLLDFDDLLLYWARMMRVEQVAASIRERFDHILVDEYQDTNPLQAEIVQGLSPNGAGLSVVGDDAQSIYRFRGATVENILNFPQQFDPPARVIPLEANYRSLQPILDTSNTVIREAANRYEKDLQASRHGEEPPKLVTAEDPDAQVDYVLEQVQANIEDGIDLKDQAVLVRSSRHASRLEVELASNGIPFEKHGGMKFMEAAHVKDAIACLRIAENPQDTVAAFRILQLLPGVGAGTARKVLDLLDGRDPAEALRSFKPPKKAQEDWKQLCDVLAGLTDGSTPWHEQPGIVRTWYGEHVERLHDNPMARMRDLEQLEQIAQGYQSRQRFLTELTLDPPESAADGEPDTPEDQLVISTVHSAKGQEYSVVYVLNCVDGMFPMSNAAETPEGEEEERRLFYVAMTRAKDQLHLCQPVRFQRGAKAGGGEYTMPPSRFLSTDVLNQVERITRGHVGPGAEARRVDTPAADISEMMTNVF